MGKKERTDSLVRRKSLGSDRWERTGTNTDESPKMSKCSTLSSIQTQRGETRLFHPEFGPVPQPSACFRQQQEGSSAWPQTRSTVQRMRSHEWGEQSVLLQALIKGQATFNRGDRTRISTGFVYVQHCMHRVSSSMTNSVFTSTSCEYSVAWLKFVIIAYTSPGS